MVARLARVPDSYALAILFAFALAVRLAYLVEVKDTEFFRTLVGDGAAFDRSALQIQNDWVGKETFYQAPLYAYCLATIYSVFGHQLLIVRVVQMTLGAGACVLLAMAGRRFFSRGAGLLAGALLAMYAPAIFFDGIVQKASLDLFLMTALLLCLSRIDSQPEQSTPALLAGVVLGALALTRENALILAPVIVLWLARKFWKGRADVRVGRPVGLFVLGLGLTLTPVVVRNYAVGHEWVLTTAQFGANFYLGNNENADGLYEPLRWAHGSYPMERQDAFDIAEEAAGRHLTPGEVSAYWSERAWSWIRSHPIQWLKLLGRKWLLIWNANEVADSDEPLVYEDESTVLRLTGMVCVFGTVFPLALAGFAATWAERRRLAILYWVVLAMAVSAALFVVFARYRFPLVPVLLLLAASGILWIVHLVRDGRTTALLAYGAMVGAGLVVVHLNLGNADNPRATAYYNLAVSLAEQGNAARAIPNYRSALDASPEFVQAHVNLGALLAQAGHFEEAVAEESAALRLMPEDAIAHTDLANALLELGRLDEAELHYHAAVQIEPNLVEARDGLATLSDVRRHLPAK